MKSAPRQNLQRPRQSAIHCLPSWHLIATGWKSSVFTQVIPKTILPVGAKKKRDTEWGQFVLTDGQTYIGSNAEDIRRNFDDHEIIAGLGLCSVINIPIKRMGTTIGTMNLLDTTAHYDERDACMGAIIAMGLASAIQ